jgi:hypothetical protein
MVKQERERLKDVYREDDNSGFLEAGRREAADKQEEFRDTELKRIDRLRLKNKKQAEQIIYQLYCELELQQEERDRIEREENEKKEREEALRVKRVQELTDERERVKAAEARDLARKKQLDDMVRQQLERQQANDQRRAEVEEKKHREFARIEEERRVKNERAAQMVKETEEKREAAYVEAKRKQEIHDRELREQKRLAQIALEEANQREAEKIQAQVAEVRRNRQQAIETKRIKTESRMLKQLIAFQQLQEEHAAKLEAARVAHEQRLHEAETFRKSVEAKKEQADRELMESEQQKLIAFRQREEENQEIRQRDAVEKAISNDDHYETATRIAAQTTAAAIESTIQYDKRMKRIMLVEQAKRKMAEEADLIRKSLEREKNKVMSSTMTSKEIGKKSPKQLRDLADQLGIDLAAVKEKARLTRRGRSKMAATLPPMGEKRAGEPRPDEGAHPTE